MTTIHLGDCLNGCATCADNYHSSIEQEVCGACGQFFPSNEADNEGFHSAESCEVGWEEMNGKTFTCQLCGQDGKDISTGEVVLPWGETCQECVKAIKKEKAINAIKASIDSTNEEEGELIADLMRAIQLLEEAN